MNQPSRGVMLAIALGIATAMGADWTRFRGPDGSGALEEANVPVRFGPTENVAWKTSLPGPGASSPITLGDKVFVTCYSGYGLSEDDPGNQQQLRLHLLCLDRPSGKILWDQSIAATPPEGDYKGFLAMHGYASSTPVTDGQAVFAFFGRSGVFAYSLEGKPLWRADVGSKTHDWGSGASPILHKNLLVVNASIESESIVALDKQTGKPVWTVPGIRESWSTPLVVGLPDGKQELVVSLHSKVLGLDPDTGEQLWHCAGPKDYICPAVIAHEGVVFICSGREPLTLAVRCGGRGDVTGTHVLWELRKTPCVPTPLYHDGYLYWMDGRRGAAACVDAKTGKMVYEKRLSGLDKSYASMVLAGGRLYGFTRDGDAVVLAAKPQFEELARNKLDDPGIVNGTPAVSDGRLLVRSDRFLYCIGE
ncbi:MAG: PQQ-binding-like beta-propeller repeat protein [Planctomycetia bacterium]|nr:PQQ-binding-like beta-propeller repeat protein [Planctomycetia bacterium]